MLWADALLDGFSLTGVPPRPERRVELEQLPLAQLVGLLHGLDPEARVDEQNRPRVVRAIEVLEVTGPPLARLRRRTPPAWTPLRIGLQAELEVIDRRLAERSRRQVERGVVEETRAALESGVPPDAPVLSGIGYAEAAGFLRGEITWQDLPDTMARANRRYARRQLRWLRRDARITWFDAGEDPVPSILEFLRERLS
jgi:tRNA dimethylallyltransferase